MNTYDEAKPSGRLATAIRLASAAHRDQVDKAGAPYILHPIRVMMRLERRSIDHMIVGVLHDVVEDTDVALRSIERLFGSTIAEAVDALTRRHDETYDQFIDRCKLNEIAVVVKMADILENMDYERLTALTFAESERLRHKYQAALARLNA